MRTVRLSAASGDSRLLAALASPGAPARLSRPRPPRSPRDATAALVGLERRFEFARTGSALRAPSRPRLSRPRPPRSPRDATAALVGLERLFEFAPTGSALRAPSRPRLSRRCLPHQRLHLAHGVAQPDEQRPGDDRVPDVQFAHAGERGDRLHIDVIERVARVEPHAGGSYRGAGGAKEPAGKDPAPGKPRDAAARHRPLAANADPPSDVISSRPSGTSIAI